MQQIFTYVYYTFVALVLALGILLFISSVSSSLIGIKVVQSGSMEPSIRTGSIVVIYQTGNYEVGDIITFFFSPNDTIPTTHRVTAVLERDGATWFETKGDANKNTDPRAIPAAAVIGEVIVSAPFVGYVLDFAKQPIGFAVIIGIPALLIIIDEVIKIHREVKAAAKKEEEVMEVEETNHV